MDYRKEVMRKKELENSGDQKIILILSSLILIAVIIVGAIMIKMLYNNNKELRSENMQLQEYFDSKDWYEGTMEPEDDSQIEAKLNKYERANLVFLQEHQ